MEYVYLFTFFRKFGIGSVITACITYALGYMLNKIGERHPGFAKYVRALTFLFSVAVFYLTELALKGKVSFDSATVQGSLTASVLSTVLSVAIDSFIKNGKIISEKKTLDKLSVEKLIEGVVKEEKKATAVKKIVSLKEKTEQAVETVLRKYAADDVSPLILKETAFCVANYFAVTETTTE